MTDRFYDGMPGPEIRRELNDAYEFMTESVVSPTSSTTLTVGTGEKILTVEENKALGIGQAVRIARTSDPLIWMDGVVTSYVGTTLKVLVSDTAGSGTYSDWTVTLSGAAGPQGDEGPQGPEGPAGPPNSLSIGTVQGGASAGATITGNAPTQTLNLTLPKGDAGDDGWSPILVLESDGDRRVLKIDDWTGGDGTKPGTGYIGSTGIVQDKANAVDVRGATGSTGATGPANSLSIGTVQGGASAGATITGAAPTQTLNLTLPKGDAGDDGWAPVLAGEVDDERRVLKVADWTGGSGTKPGTGYIGASGLTPTIGSAIDVRGAPGAGAVSKVNNVDPDGGGNVTLDTDDIAEGSTNKYFSGAAAVTAIKGDADWKASDWDTAYSWGNHASAGYATQTWVGQQGYVTTDTTYLAGTKNQLDTGSDTTVRVYTPQILAQWLAGKGYLTAHQQIKTLASQTLTGSGNVTLGDIGAAADGDVLKKASNLSDLNNAATALGNLGGTTVGQALFTVTNPSAERFVRINAANTVSLRTAAEFRSDIGAGISNLIIGTTSSTAKAGNWQPDSATQAQMLAGSATDKFLTPESYKNTVAWSNLGTVSSGTVTPNLNTALNFYLTLGGNATIGMPSNAKPGQSGELRISVSGARTLSWNANWKFIGGTPDIGASGDLWIVSYKVYSASEVIASAGLIE